MAERRRAVVSVVAVLAAVLTTSAEAAAHDLSLSRYRFEEGSEGWRLLVSTPGSEVVAVRANECKNGAPRDVCLPQHLARTVRVEDASGARVPLVVDRVALGTHVGQLSFRLPALPRGSRPRAIAVHAFEDGYAGARSLVEVEGVGLRAERLMDQGDPPLLVEPQPVPAAPSTFDFAALGLRHVLTGWDHVLFLVGLSLAGRSLRRAVAETSVFTIAHAIALVAVALGSFAPPSRIVEPLIGLSISYVAWEGLRSAPVRSGRLAAMFVTGLVHGIGVAGGLRAALSAATSFGAIAAFNGGVEVAQLAVVGLGSFFLVLLRRDQPFGRHATTALGSGLCVAGALLFVLRLRG